MEHVFIWEANVRTNVAWCEKGIQMMDRTIREELRKTASDNRMVTSDNHSENRLYKKFLLPMLVTATLLSAQSATAANFIEVVKTQANDSGFLQAFLLIFVSEIGDKTFFIAGLLAAKYGRLISFTGSIGALAVMTIISTVLGQLFHAVPASLTQGVKSSYRGVDFIVL